VARRRFDPSQARGGLFPDSAAAGTPKPEERTVDAAAAQGAAAQPEGAEQSTDLSVTDAARLLDDALSRLPRPLRIVGQIGSLSARTHWYFNLKDETSVIQCVMWGNRAARAPALREGDEVRVTGAFSFYAPSGKTSFIVDAIEPRGLGSLEARFRALCAELQALGWFDEARKPRLPMLPRRIAIITSRSGAALRDCLATAAARCPCVDILVVDVPVQGDGAAEEIARAIGAVDARAEALGIDAMLVTRGGGSREDLWAFNERVVAEAAFRCRTPIVAAIGHEPDLEIIELVAHREATPTRGIVRLLPDREALRTHLSHLRARAGRALARRLDSMRQHLASLSRHDLVRRPTLAVLARPRADLEQVRFGLERALRALLNEHRRTLGAIALRVERTEPSTILSEARQRVRHLAWRAAHAGRASIERRRELLHSLGRHLEGIGPERVLARGYSITRSASGAIVRDAAALQPGERLATRFARGSAESEVRAIAPDDGREGLPAGAPGLDAAPRGSEARS